MSGIATFFRHCPYCGRRFEIRLVSKKELSETDVVDKGPPDGSSRALLRNPNSGMIADGRAIMEEGAPMLFVEEEFEYSYRCKHCGHEWSEIHDKELGMKAKGYTGD